MILKVLILSVIVTICFAQHGIDWRQQSNNNDGKVYRLPQRNNTNKQTTNGTYQQNNTPRQTSNTEQKQTESDTKPGQRQETEDQYTKTPSDQATPKAVHLTRSLIQTFQQNLRTFSTAVYYKINEKNGANDNIFFSPISISHAMGMVNAGARGNSSMQIKESLMMTEPTSTDLINAAFQHVTKDKFDWAHDSDVIAWMAARSFFMTGFSVRKQYVRSLKQFYHSAVEEINFNESKKSADRINGWVKEQTTGLIKDLISPDMITPLTRLVLVNALYFKAPWTERFTELSPNNFTTPTGIVKVPYLYNKLECKSQEKNGYEYLAVPYKDKETYFVIIMPKTDKDMKKFESKRSLFEFFKLLKRRVIKDWKDEKISLYIPAFTLEKSLDVKETLKTMGVTDIFSIHHADLSGVSEEFIYVTDFVHKARITVSKDGTEAAAATAAASAKRMLESLKTVKIDRPFIFAVYERGNILFMGKLVNPLGK